MKLQISILQGFCHVFVYSNARKLFEGIRQTRPSILGLHHAVFCSKPRAYYASDPVEAFPEDYNVVSWTCKISALVGENRPEEAVCTFRNMLLMGEHRPNYVTILSVIRAAGAMHLEVTTQEIHGMLIKMGFESETKVITVLVGAYSFWDFDSACKLFDQITQKDLVLWSAMVSICAKVGLYVKAFEFLRGMLHCGVQPNYVTTATLLPCCANLGALSLGRQIHGFSVKNSFYLHNSVQNSLVDMYSKCRDFEACVQTFNMIEVKDTISFKTMIYACTENAHPRKALEILLEMHSSCIEVKGPEFQNAISACLQAEEFLFGLQLHCGIFKKGLMSSVSVGTSLLRMYGGFGEVELALNVFNQLHHKDLIAWSAMVSVYAQSEHPDGAVEAYRKMQLANVKPNEMTFVSLLQACSSMGAQELGESIQACVTKAGYSSNPFISSTLIDFYCKSGRINQGRIIFEETLTKDLICWSSMINGYGLNGQGEEALKTFSNMLGSGLEPNEIVFLSVLSACGHCGLEYEGWNWFYLMKDRYNITPKLAHYACMVDLLSRQGNVKKAFEFVQKMPVDPDKRIWGAILAGCRSTSGCIEIAEFVADQLILLDPLNTSYYVILSNMYAEQGRWKDVEKLRQVVDEKGLKKSTGCSVI